MDVGPARVALLGGFWLGLGEDTVLDLPHGVQRLVAYLGLAHRPARAAVAGQLWPDVPEDQAHGSLRSALWRLQKAAPGVVDVTGGALCLARGVRVDVREAARWARRVLDRREDVPDAVPRDVELRGELLPGWYDDWVLLERERLRQLRLHAMEALADGLARHGRYGEAVQVAHDAVQVEPLRETAHRTLVRIHLAEGNLVEAVRAYESFRAALASEMGVSPSPRMEALLAGARRPPASRTVVPIRRDRPATAGTAGFR
ncbi:AfsR/SARP family transcriptional regulator [Geodermatophilus amargosae]|uniref:AfsR/SARP family transcriptional regulator n=1 Tax=Geodermatophilus amargosae TaxID=1296565 RepID=UPI0034DEEAEC